MWRATWSKDKTVSSLQLQSCTRNSETQLRNWNRNRVAHIKIEFCDKASDAQLQSNHTSDQITADEEPNMQANCEKIGSKKRKLHLEYAVLEQSARIKQTVLADWELETALVLVRKMHRREQNGAALAMLNAQLESNVFFKTVTTTSDELHIDDWRWSGVIVSILSFVICLTTALAMQNGSDRVDFERFERRLLRVESVWSRSVPLLARLCALSHRLIWISVQIAMRLLLLSIVVASTLLSCSALVEKLEIENDDRSAFHITSFGYEPNGQFEMTMTDLSVGFIVNLLQPYLFLLACWFLSWWFLSTLHLRTSIELRSCCNARTAMALVSRIPHRSTSAFMKINRMKMRPRSSHWLHVVTGKSLFSFSLIAIADLSSLSEWSLEQAKAWIQEDDFCAWLLSSVFLKLPWRYASLIQCTGITAPLNWFDPSCSFWSFERPQCRLSFLHHAWLFCFSLCS